MRRKTSIFLLAALALFQAACAKPVIIAGSSMSPTFNEGDRLMMNTSPGEILRGDVIMFRSPRDKSVLIINRVIGLSGETVLIRNGRVIIDGAPLDEPYLQNTNGYSRDFGPVSIPDNHFFVMGDNRDNSLDSRDWGPVGKELVTGKYYTTYWKAETK
jgi:signal peptidase I